MKAVRQRRYLPTTRTKSDVKVCLFMRVFIQHLKVHCGLSSLRTQTYSCDDDERKSIRGLGYIEQ